MLIMVDSREGPSQADPADNMWIFYKMDEAFEVRC